MKNKKFMSVPPKSFQRGRNSSKIHLVLLAALAAGMVAVSAQDGPPIPDLPPYEPPRELTPEELEAQRLAREEVWRRNREIFAPFLHSAPAPEPEDLARKQRLMSAELAERKRKVEMDSLRDKRLLDWAAEQHQNFLRSEEMVDRLASKEMREFFSNAGVRLVFRDGRLAIIQSLNKNVSRTISTWKAKTNAPIDYPLNVNGQLVGLWEGSVPGTNHAEFNNGGIARLIYLDTIVSTNNRAHATEMAGTIAAQPESCLMQKAWRVRRRFWQWMPTMTLRK